MTTASARPLNFIQMLLYPILAAGKRGERREILERRRYLAMHRARVRREQASVKAQLRVEAKLYSQILVAQWTRLGAYYAYRWRLDQTEQARVRRRKKTEKVRFERVVTTPEALYFKILVGRRTMFGYKSMIPHKVMVRDLISDESLAELSFACQRPVTCRRTIKGGVWVIVHRNESLSEIPKYVRHVEMLDHYPDHAGDTGAIVIGVGEHRTVQHVDLEHYPHVLVGGASGGGKSNMLNNILCSLIRFSDHRDLKLILIDPKRLELTFYADAPHLLGGIIYEVEEALQILDVMILEVKKRTAILEGRSRKLSDFNTRFPAEKLPRIVIVIEELAALIGQTKKTREEVHEKLTQLANLGRAVGVHIILCTQLPIVSVVPSTIKVSMWVRLCGRVQSPEQSRVIVQTSAAAHLPSVAGRMIFSKDSYTFEVQTPHITDEDVDLTIRIAIGRKLGYVRLDGAMPVINPDRLIRAIATDPKFMKMLDVELITSVIGQYGISRRQVRAFVEDAIKAEEFIVNFVRYQVVKHNGKYYIVGDSDEDETAEEEAVWQPVAPPILYLPAPAPAEPPPPEPEPPPPPSIGEVLEMFMQDRCVFEPNAWVSSADFYAAYTKYAEEFGYRIHSQIEVGRTLGNMGLEVKRRGRARDRGWRNVRLANDRLEYPPDEEDAA